MKLTLDQTNPDYFNLVQERTEKRIALDCFKQARRLLSKYVPIHSCLDIGCASGYLYFHIHDLIKEYCGIDPSLKFIDYGKSYFKQQMVTNAVHYCTWFETFASKQKFDALICLGLFYIFPNYQWYIAEMMRLSRKIIIIRSLFADKTEYRYVPEMPGSSFWTYYNIYSTQEITDFVESRNWQIEWHEDDYIKNNGGHYETAGLDFPFKYLVIKSKFI